MLEQTAFDLLRGKPFASDFQHVVGAAAIGEVAVGVTHDQVAGHVPFAPEGVPGFVRLLPVTVRQRVAAHPQGTHLAVGQLAALVVAHSNIESRYHLSDGPGSRGARAIRDEDVPHLGGAQAVQQLDAERRLPALEQLDGQSLAGRGAHS